MCVFLYKNFYPKIFKSKIFTLMLFSKNFQTLLTKVAFPINKKENRIFFLNIQILM